MISDVVREIDKADFWHIVYIFRNPLPLIAPLKKEMSIRATKLANGSGLTGITKLIKAIGNTDSARSPDFTELLKILAVRVESLVTTWYYNDIQAVWLCQAIWKLTALQSFSLADVHRLMLSAMKTDYMRWQYLMESHAKLLSLDSQNQFFNEIYHHLRENASEVPKKTLVCAIQYFEEQIAPFPSCEGLLASLREMPEIREGNDSDWLYHELLKIKIGVNADNTALLTKVLAEYDKNREENVSKVQEAVLRTPTLLLNPKIEEIVLNSFENWPVSDIINLIVRCHPVIPDGGALQARMSDFLTMSYKLVSTKDLGRLYQVIRKWFMTAELDKVERILTSKAPTPNEELEKIAAILGTPGPVSPSLMQYCFESLERAGEPHGYGPNEIQDRIALACARRTEEISKPRRQVLHALITERQRFFKKATVKYVLESLA
jgi:hypothetical protein